MRSTRTGSAAAAARRDETRLRELDRKTATPDDATANLPRGVVGRGRRVGNAYPIAGGTTRLIMDIVGRVEAGRSYRVHALVAMWVDGGGASYSELFLNYTLDGSLPSATDAASRLDQSAAGIAVGGGIVVPTDMVTTFVPPTDGDLRVLLSVKPGDSARNYGVYSNAALKLETRMWIHDDGDDPGDSTTNY